jgi:release factor glutamine methyltransferase
MLELRTKETARSAVLQKLGLASLVSTSKVDILASHHAHVVEQTIPKRFLIDGLTIDAPAGVYHPTPNSSSELFLRNLKAMNPKKIHKVLEIGAGCGAISLYIAAHWDSKVVASDISSIALDSVRKNAALNGLTVETIQSDLFENINEKDFDLIIFNAPLIDKKPENSIEKNSLCDPGGRITDAYLTQAKKHIRQSGLIIVSICSNSAYEVLEDVPLKFKIVGFELSYSGFWWAVVGAEL